MADPRLTDDVTEAARVLRRGGLVAFPTETVYGLGADARNPESLRRLYEAKGRPADHPVIVHLGRREEVAEWAAHVPRHAEALIDAFWPGPLTLILPRNEAVLDQVTGGQDTVGLRMPDHPVALGLLREFGGGLAAPSANLFGRLSPTRPEHVASELGDRVDLILTGEPSRVGLESTIVNLTGNAPEILRPGHVRPDQLAEVLGSEVPVVSRAGAVRAAGTLASHYAPTTPLRVVSGEELLDDVMAAGRVAVLARFPAPADLPEDVLWLQSSTDPATFARELYANLRFLDQRGAREILVEAAPEDSPAWTAIADRLRRAAAG